MNNFILETNRLILRPLTTVDAEVAFVWCGDLKVNRYMPYPLYTDVENVRKWLATVEQNNNSFEFGFVNKEIGVLIGSGGIGPNEDNTQWEVGYNLRADYWNKGYATEAAKCMIEFANREFNIHNFGANHAIDNPASGKVLEHCGMHFDHYGEYTRFDGSETFKAKFYKMHIE
jgi:ribosomal-protein-alanine N-acetyltransferase